MSGFLRAFVERGLGRGPALQLRGRSPFEPAPKVGPSEGPSIERDGRLEESVETLSVPDLRGERWQGEPRPTAAGRPAASDGLGDADVPPVTRSERGEPGAPGGDRETIQRRPQAAGAGPGDVRERPVPLGEVGPTRVGGDGRSGGEDRARLERADPATARSAGEVIEPMTKAPQPARRDAGRVEVSAESRASGKAQARSGGARDMLRPAGVSTPAKTDESAAVPRGNDPVAEAPGAIPRPGALDAGARARSLARPAAVRPSTLDRAVPAPPPFVVVDRRSPSRSLPAAEPSAKVSSDGASTTRPTPSAAVMDDARNDRRAGKSNSGDRALSAEVVAPTLAPSSQARGQAAAQSGQRQLAKSGEPSGAKPSAASSSDRVSIQIGRIEVRAVPAEAPPARTAAPRSQGLSLDAYLQQLSQRAQ